MLRNKLPFYQNVTHVCTKSCKFIVCLKASTCWKVTYGVCTTTIQNSYFPTTIKQACGN